MGSYTVKRFGYPLVKNSWSKILSYSLFEDMYIEKHESVADIGHGEISSLETPRDISESTGDCTHQQSFITGISFERTDPLNFFF